MGNWFSNLHVRKNDSLTEKKVVECIRSIMTQQEYIPVDSEDDADVSFAIVTDDRSQWYSVYSDTFTFDDPKQFKSYASPISLELDTDVLGIACFDSDYLYLNLINSVHGEDAWVGIGSSAGSGIRRRTGLAKWKNKVSDLSTFSDSVKKEYVLSEEVLENIEHCIHLPQEYGVASYEYLSDFEFKTSANYLYFKLPESMQIKDEVKLVQYTSSLMPFYVDKYSTVSVINAGGASKGLWVYFIGPYVENEEITFSHLSFRKWQNNKMVDIPFELKKTQLSDGQWAYYYHDPEYKILPRVDDRLPPKKHQQVTFERSITVNFVPHGNPRKILDITVVLVPDKNWQGQTSWNVWHMFGSKKAYIQDFNDGWSEIPGKEYLLLREEDFD